MRKSTIKIVFILVLLSICSTSAFAAAYSAELIISGENRYKAIQLHSLIYNNANSDLSDILIVDSTGANVPFFFHQGSSNSYSSTEQYTLMLTNSYLKDDSFYFDYKLATERSSDTISTSIVFTTQSINFAKTVEVYGSYDDIHWDYIQNDTIYSIDGKSKLAIVFSQPQKFTHFRLKLANNLEQIHFSSAILEYNVLRSEDIYFRLGLIPVYTVENSDKQTTITIEGLRNLRLCDITIQTKSMFQRNVYTSQGPFKELYNLTFDEVSYSDTTIPLNWLVSQEDTYVLTIFNGDDKPIEIDGIFVRYYGADIVFEGVSSEIYTLEFGRDSAKNAPVYDIVRYSSEILKEAIDRGSIGQISIQEQEEIPQPRDYRAFFNIIVVIVALLLGTIIIMKLRQKT